MSKTVLKTKKKLLIILLSALSIVLLILAFGGYHLYQIFYNEWEYDYKRYIPLGKNHQYYLRINDPSNGYFHNYPAGEFYYVEPISDDYPSLTPYGHWIISSETDLEPFVDELVTIEGKISTGKIMIRAEQLVATASAKNKNLFSHEFVGVSVKDLKKVDEHN